MDFYAILDQVIAVLRQRQRVTYRALKVQFQLDDDALEALKEELIEAQHLAADEMGRILVWTGGAAVPPTTTPPLPQAEASPAALPPPDAERRQLTVMFCDLVDSTALSGQLDPEDLRDVVRAYQQVCSEVITRFDGHIAQLLGDGLLVYFGYPHAHEDDVQRAVRTGLGILDAMKDLNTRLKQAKAIQLALRLGIHTGLVVVGAMGGQGRQEQLALGETPNIAARIQGLAAPNTVAISDASYRLVQGYFDCEALGEQTLRGVAEPAAVYRVLSESGAQSRLDIAQPRGLTPLVGRESEVTLLLDRWAQVKDGQGHVVLLSGEGGIGKSRLVHRLKEHVVGEKHLRLECRSSPYYQNTVLYPIIDLLQRTLRWQPHDTSEEKLAQLAQELSQYRLPVEVSVPLFAPLLALHIPENHYPPLNLSPQRQRQKTLETLVAILLDLAEHQPVLFIVEDLHWSDPSTRELLSLVIDQTPTASVLVLLTCRPTFQPSWSHRSSLTEVTINRLSPTQVAQIINGMTDGTIFPAAVLQQIMDKTDGVPLFVEEMTKAILESGQLKDVGGHYELTGSLSTFVIPATLQDSLMARLDRLSTVKAVAQLGATLGRQFAYDLLQAISPLDERTLQQGLRQLVEAELLYQRGIPPQATYLFKHALIRDAAYESLLRSTRQQYHQRIAQVLEAQFPETTEAQPELLAHHYTEAGLIAQALPYWRQAGQRALERSAYVEAISHLTKGLEVLRTLPDTMDHTQQELDLQTILGLVLIASKGYASPDVERVYAQARALCQRMGETIQLFPVLRGSWLFYLNRGELQVARELGEQLLRLAQGAQDPLLLLEAHSAPGVTLFWLGELARARAHLEQSIAFYERQQDRSLAFRYGHDPSVMCRGYLAYVLWWLGYPDQALQQSHEALMLAQELAHPFSLAYALHNISLLHELRHEEQAGQERAEAVIALSREQGFPYWLALGTIRRGWALAAQGQGAEGVQQIQQGIAAWHATGADVNRPWWLALLAEACGKANKAEEGLTAVAEALTAVHTTANRVCEAELYRLQGELRLMLATDNAAEAETCFRQAFDIARRQQAKSLELRAAMSLARLWQQPGKRAEAYALLAPVYGWFTEGFDTADLQEAKALLHELEGAR